MFSWKICLLLCISCSYRCFMGLFSNRICVCMTFCCFIISLWKLAINSYLPGESFSSCVEVEGSHYKPKKPDLMSFRGSSYACKIFSFNFPCFNFSRAHVNLEFQLKSCRMFQRCSSFSQKHPDLDSRILYYKLPQNRRLNYKRLRSPKHTCTV